MNGLKIYIAGHTGMVGSTVLDMFRDKGYSNVITRSRSELDLRSQEDVEYFVTQEHPDAIILTAGMTNGILASDQYSYQSLHDKLAIQNNMINAAHKNDVEQLLFLGSSCFYPKHAPQPLKEAYLLTGSLEPAIQWYAIAKMAGIKLCESLNKQNNRNYTALIPADVYGPGDEFDPWTSHVVLAMIRKFHDAREDKQESVRISGPKRGCLNVQDLADAIIFTFENNLPGSIYNIGTGEERSMKNLAWRIKQITGYQGEIVWDSAKPDNLPSKLLDVSKIHSEGWNHKADLREGLAETYEWFLEHKKELKEVAI